MLKLRYDVLRKPLGLEITEQDKAHDPDATHLLCLVDGVPAGVITLLKTGRLIQMAVSEEFRGLQLGKRLVAALEDLARTQGITEICLASRGYAIPFYEKYGYETYGEFYEKVGMPHKMMKKLL